MLTCNTKLSNLTKSLSELPVDKYCVYLVLFYNVVYFDVPRLTLSLPRSSIDDLVFSVFPSNFFQIELQN